MESHWPKSPADLVEHFATLVPDAPGVQRKKMFGYPCAVLGGYMFMSLHGEKLVLKLPDAEREQRVLMRPVELPQDGPAEPLETRRAAAERLAHPRCVEPAPDRDRGGFGIHQRPPAGGVSDRYGGRVGGKNRTRRDEHEQSEQRGRGGPAGARAHEPTVRAIE